MSATSTMVETRIRLSAHHLDQLHKLSQNQQMSEDQIIEKALNLLFDVIRSSDEQAGREGWSLLSESSLSLVWDNETDAAYDNWRGTTLNYPATPYVV